MRRRAYDRNVELRANEEGGSTITGYAAVFYRASDPQTEYQLGKRFKERIHRDAFNRALDEGDDVRGLFNHDSNFVLGRTSAGTLRLSVDDTGLRYDIDTPDTQIGRDVAESIRRGDVSGSSFAFEILEEDREDVGEDTVFTIRNVKLYDVGPVTFPAYEATSTQVRNEMKDDPRYSRNYRSDSVDRDFEFATCRLRHKG